jgi:hypothetical protein
MSSQPHRVFRTIDLGAPVECTDKGGFKKASNAQKKTQRSDKKKTAAMCTRASTDVKCKRGDLQRVQLFVFLCWRAVKLSAKTLSSRDPRWPNDIVSHVLNTNCELIIWVSFTRSSVLCTQIDFILDSSCHLHRIHHFSCTNIKQRRASFYHSWYSHQN